MRNDKKRLFGWHTLLMLGFMWLLPLQRAHADVLVQWLFWDEMSKQAGNAAKSYAEYKRERQLWQDNVEAAKRELKQCGGCASAQAKLKKWQGIENQFQDVAGRMALAVGMPASVAKALGIDTAWATGRTPEQRLQECTIVRGDWVDKLPDACRIAVDDYYDCVRDYQKKNGLCVWEKSKTIGGQCWDKWKLRYLCGNGDFDAFEREKRIQAERRAGAVIPEYEGGPYRVVYYGKVAENYVPALPPTDVINDTLEEDDVLRINFLMTKSRTGTLTGITFAHFHQDFVDPYTRCFSANAPTDEINRRICTDLEDFRWEYKKKTVLICDYNGQPVGNQPRYVYWYVERPEGAAPETLLSRSHQHPALRISGIRKSCPATMDEAEKANSEWQANMQALRNKTPETAVDIVMKRPDWLQKQVDEKQARHAAANRRLADAYKALSTFPLEGRYQLSVQIEDNEKLLDCVIVRQPTQFRNEFSCLSPTNDPISLEAVQTGGVLQVSFSNPPYGFAGHYIVDLDYGEAGKGQALRLNEVGAVTPKKSSGPELVRVGDLVKIRDLPMEGRYALTVSKGANKLTAECTVAQLPRSSDLRFTFKCPASDGKVYKSIGYLPEEDSGALWFQGWDPLSGIVVNGERVLNLYFYVSDGFNPGHPNTVVLVGRANQGIVATLQRLGDLPGKVASTSAISPTSDTNPRAGRATATPSKTDAKGSGKQDVALTADRHLIARSMSVNKKRRTKVLVRKVEALSDGRIRVFFQTGGPKDLTRPDTSCLVQKTNNRKIRPSAMKLDSDRPGHFVGRLDFVGAEPGEWYFQYACEDGYSLAQIEKAGK